MRGKAEGQSIQERSSAKGRFKAFLAYAFRVAEHETGLQVVTSTDPGQLSTAGDIGRFIRGITVYPQHRQARGSWSREV